jgi:glucosylceramidase
MKVEKLYQIKNNELFSLPPRAFEEGEYEMQLLNIYNEKIAPISGFGGAFTDSSAYNYHLANDTVKKQMLEELFGESGLKYNFCRLCVGSSDFAVEEFCYVQDDDYTLETFSIARDKKYVIPFLKDALAYTKGNIYLFASPWSPPTFMKTTDSRFRGGKLRKECYELYAEYIVKFLQAYQEEGIKISALTLQNEPMATQTWESCCYTTEDEIEYAKVLKNTLGKHNLSDVKLYCWDHNKERVFEKANTIFNACGGVIDGIGYHWYSGEHFDGVRLVHQKFPDKFLFASEFCISSVEDRVENLYANEILNDINCGSNAICEWNLILDEEGGPYHNRQGGCAAPIRFNTKTGEVTKGETYYDMYIFSHFVKQGAVSLYTSSFYKDVQVTAFENPDGQMVVVVNNMGRKRKDVRVYINKQFYPLPLDAKSKYVLVIE